MTIKKRMVLRTVAGESMLVPVGKSAKDYNGIFTITPSAAIAFAGIQNGKTEQEIIADILNKYDVDETTAKADYNNFLGQLEALDIIDVGP